MQESRSHWWQMLVVCAIACGARSGMLWWQGERLNDDVDAYVEIGLNLARGNGFSLGHPPHFTAYRPVLLPLLIAGIVKLGGSSFALGLVHVMLGTLATGLTFRIGRLLNLGSASLIAAGLVAVDPLLLRSTVSPMTEALCATLVVLWCWVVLEYPVDDATRAIPRPTRGLIHGACFGLICLCRPGFLAAIGFVVAGMLWQLIVGYRKRAGLADLARISQAAVWNMIGLSIVVAPWMLRNAVVLGKPTPATTHGGYTLLLGNNPTFYHEVVLQPWGTVWQGASLTRWQQELEIQMANQGIHPSDEVARDRWMYRLAETHIRAEPWLFVRASVWRAVRFWGLAPWNSGGLSRMAVRGTSIFYGFVLIGIFVGLCRLSPLEWKTWRILLLLPLTLWVTHWFYWTDMRMRAPVVPILALLAARAIVWRRNP